MAPTIRLDDETRGILARMSIDGVVATLPSGQLPRPVYEKVNKALTALGGKWDRRKGGHVFKADPTALLRGGVEAGSVENLKQKYQFFETPADLAAKMVALAGVNQDMRVLEPSAGRGRLVRPCRDLGADVLAVEIWDDNIPYLNALPGVAVRHADFLEVGPLLQFDAVVMNPPFANKQSIRHIRRAWDWLGNGGTLVAICDGGAMTNGSREYLDFREWLESVGAEREELPAGTFAESGTQVASWLITAQRSAP